MTDKKSIDKFARHRARKLTLQALYQWRLAATDLIDLEKQYLADANPKKVDIDYFQTLVHDIPKHVTELDAEILPLLDRPEDQIGPIELSILRMGAYELIHRIDVPYRVVLNEAIELSKVFGPEQSHTYINGVLDKLAKSKRQIEMGNQAP